MKVRRLTIEGLRGAPVEFELKLDGKSMLLYGENGHGKSTITDSLELWSTGKLAGYDRRGARIENAVHVDCDRATVTLDVAGEGTYARMLRGQVVSDLEQARDGRANLREAGADTDVSALTGLPMLRHETMGRFMDERPGPKKKELMALLGLEELINFRDTLKTACNRIRDRHAEAQNRRDREQSATDSLTAGKDVVTTAQEQRQKAGLTGDTTSEAELLALDLEDALPSQEPNRVALVAALEGSIASLPPDPSQRWNVMIADVALAANDTLSRLAEAGQAALELQHEDVCPLCRSPYGRDDLGAELRKRAGELAATRNQLTDERGELERFNAGLSGIRSAAREVLASAPKTPWSKAADLERLVENIGAQIDALTAASRDLVAAPAAPVLVNLGLLEAFKAEASSAAGSESTAALLALKGLKDQVVRLHAEQAELDRIATRKTAADQLLAITEQEVEKAIRTALDDLSDLIERYYTELAYGGLYSDIKLKYLTTYAGGIEFSVVFDGRKTISPPQAIMSTSQLNALGLAMFLARANKREPNWRAVVLDDVVNSFDASFRQGLIRILVSDFADWQVLLLSHDRAFTDLVRREGGSGWRQQQIVRWTPAGGPILGAGDPLERLRELLGEGASAAECAGWARQALEGRLGHIVAKLEYEVPYRPHGRYTAGDFLVALRRGLAHSNEELAKLPALARLEGDNYMAALGVHDREDAAALSVADFARLADDLEELMDGLRCADCHEPVWKAQRGDHHACQCSRMVA